MEMKKKEKSGSLSPVTPALKRDSGDEGKGSRSSSKSEKELKLPPEKSSEDGLKKDRSPAKNSDSSNTLERYVVNLSLGYVNVQSKVFLNLNFEEKQRGLGQGITIPQQIRGVLTSTRRPEERKSPIQKYSDSSKYSRTLVKVHNMCRVKHSFLLFYFWFLNQSL